MLLNEILLIFLKNNQNIGTISDFMVCCMSSPFITGVVKRPVPGMHHTIEKIFGYINYPLKALDYVVQLALVEIKLFSSD